MIRVDNRAAIFSVPFPSLSNLGEQDLLKLISNPLLKLGSVTTFPMMINE